MTRLIHPEVNATAEGYFLVIIIIGARKSQDVLAREKAIFQ